RPRVRVHAAERVPVLDQRARHHPLPRRERLRDLEHLPRTPVHRFAALGSRNAFDQQFVHRYLQSLPGGAGRPACGAPRMVGSEGRATGIADARHRLLRRLLSGPRRLLGLALGLTAPLALLGRLLGLSAPRGALLGLSAPRGALLGLLPLLGVAGDVALLVSALRCAALAPVDLLRLRRRVLRRRPDLVHVQLDRRALVALTIRERPLLETALSDDPRPLLERFADVLRRVAPDRTAQEQRLLVLPLPALPVELPRRRSDRERCDRDARLGE